MTASQWEAGDSRISIPDCQPSCQLEALPRAPSAFWSLPEKTTQKCSTLKLSSKTQLER